MLIPILNIIMPPMQTRMIHTISVPRLEDIDLAIIRPGEWLGRQ
jgi:hypothetical protein